MKQKQIYRVPFAFEGNKIIHYTKHIRPLIQRAQQEIPEIDGVIEPFAGSLNTAIQLLQEFKDLKNNEFNTLHHFLNYVITLLNNNEPRFFIALQNIKEFLVTYLINDNDPTKTDGRKYKTCKNKLRELYEINSPEFYLFNLFFGLSSTKPNKWVSSAKSIKIDKRIKEITEWTNKIKTIKEQITEQPFNELKTYNNKIIMVDPPYINYINTYIKKIHTDETYATNEKGENWNIDDNKRLIEYIKANQNRNNFIIVWTSNDNDLAQRIKAEIPTAKKIDVITRKRIYTTNFEVYENIYIIK